jgi:hypothetical protein
LRPSCYRFNLEWNGAITSMPARLLQIAAESMRCIRAGIEPPSYCSGPPSTPLPSTSGPNVRDPLVPLCSFFRCAALRKTSDDLASPACRSGDHSAAEPNPQSTVRQARSFGLRLHALIRNRKWAVSSVSCSSTRHS